MRKKKIKGFTLVELSIVIAVIAILIAVLVPTFIALIDNANESRDIQTLYNVNNALSMENASNKIETPEQALDVAEEAGYTIDKISPTSDGSIIVYDQKTVSFALVKDNAVTYPENSSIDLDAETTWYFVSSQAELTAGSSNVSYILTGEWNATVTYEGAGGIETSRATVNAGVYIKYVASTSQSSPAKQAVKTSVKALTSDSDSTYPIIFNYGNTWGLTYEPGNRTVKPVIYGDKNYNPVDSNGKTLANAEEYVTVSSTSSAVQDSNLGYTKDASGTIFFTYDNVIVTATNIISCEDGTITIELGNTDHPYTIASEDDYYKINKGGYCLVTADITASSALRITDVTSTLDLNGHTIIAGSTFTVNVDSGATLNITDSSDVPGTIDNNANANKYTINVSGTLTVEKIAIVRTCTSKSYYAVCNNGGTFIMESGSITSFTALYSATSASVTTIKGGTITGTGTSGYAVKIDAGTFNVDETDSENPVTISGTTQGIYMTGGTVNIYGGLISSSSTSSYGIYMKNSAEDAVGAVNIYGGSITSGKYGVYSNITDGTLNISDCVISGNTYGIYSYAGSEITVNNSTITGGTTGIYTKGSLTVNSGTITGTKSNGVGINNDGGTATINGGTISGYCTSNFNIYLTSTGGSGLVNKNSGTLSINGGEISGTWFGIYNNGTLEVYGGTISGGTMGIFAKATKVTIGGLGAEDRNITIKGATSAYADTENSHGYESAIYAKLGATVGIYSGTINGLRGVAVFGSSSNVSTLNIYGGYIDTTEFAVCNNGSSGSNYAKISVTGGTITSSGAAAIYLPAAYGTTTISGGTITGKTGVEVRGGSLTITGGEFEATAKSFSATYNNSGSTVGGAALAISTYNQVNLEVSVENCTLKGVYAIYECYVNGTYDSNSNLLAATTAPTYTVTVTVSNIITEGEVYSQNTTIST